MEKKFDWIAGISVPSGYPVETIYGGFYYGNGIFFNLYTNPDYGNGIWGFPRIIGKYGIKDLPNHLHVTWLSYRENKFYEINTDLDYKKILTFFQEGFYEELVVDISPRKAYYREIIVGYAPGGTVSIWLKGPGHQIEVGHYQGKEITISQEQIENLSSSLHNLSDLKYRQNMVYNWYQISQEILKNQENIPIPYHLWKDQYETKYKWKAVFELPKEIEIKDISIQYFNGEYEELFGESIQKKYEIPDEKMKIQNYRTRAVPKSIKFCWLDKTQVYGEIIFNEEIVFAAFEQAFKENLKGSGNLIIRVNKIKDYFSVILKVMEKEVWINSRDKFRFREICFDYY